MPIYPPRNEPIRKIEILNKRINELRKSIGSNESEEVLRTKTEKVRIAKLNLIKARLSLLRSYRQEDEKELNMRILIKLEEDFSKWESLSFDEIISEIIN